MSGRARPRDNACSLHLSNVTPDTRPDDLYDIFEKYGKVKDVYIPRDYYTGHPRGFAYVQFYEEEAADLAYRKNEYVTLRGQKMSVDWARGGRKSAVEMRGRMGNRSPRRRRRSWSRSPVRRRSPSPRDRYDRRYSPDRYRDDDRGRRMRWDDDDRGGYDRRADSRDSGRNNGRGDSNADSGYDRKGSPGYYAPLPAASDRPLAPETGW